MDVRMDFTLLLPAANALHSSTIQAVALIIIIVIVTIIHIPAE